MATNGSGAAPLRGGVWLDRWGEWFGGWGLLEFVWLVRYANGFAFGDCVAAYQGSERLV